MTRYLTVFAGGGIGSLCRYLVSSVVNGQTKALFPFGTFTVNCAGSLLVGFFFYLFERCTIPSGLRILLMTGFLGGFTTFSSFSMETINLFRGGENRLFLLNLVGTNACCLFLTGAGIYCAKLFLLWYNKTC